MNKNPGLRSIGCVVNWWQRMWRCGSSTDNTIIILPIDFPPLPLKGKSHLVFEIRYKQSRTWYKYMYSSLDTDVATFRIEDSTQFIALCFIARLTRETGDTVIFLWLDSRRRNNAVCAVPHQETDHMSSDFPSLQTDKKKKKKKLGRFMRRMISSRNRNQRPATKRFYAKIFFILPRTGGAVQLPLLLFHVSVTWFA